MFSYLDHFYFGISVRNYILKTQVKIRNKTLKQQVNMQNYI